MQISVPLHVRFAKESRLPAAEAQLRSLSSGEGHHTHRAFAASYRVRCRESNTPLWGASARPFAAVCYGIPITPKSNATKRKPGRTREVKVWHVFEISDWDWDFTFGLYKSKFHPGPFFDSRNLKLHGSLLSPKKIAAKVISPKLNLSPQDNLTETGRASITDPKHVGVVYTRGKSYQATLFFPADVFGPILQMLIANRYRYVKIEVGEVREGGYSEVTTFYFSGKLEDDDPT